MQPRTVQLFCVVIFYDFVLHVTSTHSQSVELSRLSQRFRPHPSLRTLKKMPVLFHFPLFFLQFPPRSPLSWVLIIDLISLCSRRNPAWCFLLNAETKQRFGLCWPSFLVIRHGSDQLSSHSCPQPEVLRGTSACMHQSPLILDPGSSSKALTVWIDQVPSSFFISLCLWHNYVDLRNSQSKVKTHEESRGEIGFLRGSLFFALSTGSDIPSRVTLKPVRRHGLSRAWEEP